MQNNILKIFFIGDAVGKPGRKVLKKHISNLKNALKPDFLIVNIENLAGGFGITEKTFNDINNLGIIDAYTSGNHIWDKKEAENFLQNHNNILRPANYPDSVPGKGWIVLEKNGKKLSVINLMGRTLMKDCVDCPFACIEKILPEIKKNTHNILIDFHAEATSEKEAMGYFLNGKVSAVIGTHTHVQTADNRVLDQGTAYITDAGMTGTVESIIGFNQKEVIEKFLTQMPKRFQVKDNGRKEIQGVFLTLDNSTGKSLTIERIKYKDY
jgi:metallophosphoesterase (TIGR00282 family)